MVAKSATSCCISREIKVTRVDVTVATPDQPNHQSRHPQNLPLPLFIKAARVGQRPWTPLTFISILPSNSPLPSVLFLLALKPLDYLPLLNKDPLDHTFSLTNFPWGRSLVCHAHCWLLTSHLLFGSTRGYLLPSWSSSHQGFIRILVPGSLLLCSI